MVDGTLMRRQAVLELAEAEVRHALPYLVRGGKVVDGIGLDRCPGVPVGIRGADTAGHEDATSQPQSPQLADQAFEVDLRAAHIGGWVPGGGLHDPDAAGDHAR